MNNFRPHHPKTFGNRGPDLPYPWMTEQEIVNMRRQNPQFNSVLQNMPATMHPPMLISNNMLSSNKSFMNQNSCKMSSSNFTHSPNPDIFKPPHSVNDSSFANRFIGDRFSSNSYPANLQHRMSDGASFKDFPGSNMPPQLHKIDGFSEGGPKLFPNLRQPQERFSCMQKDQTQFHRKYNNSQMFQGKDFPFSNKEVQPQNPAPFNDKVPATTGGNFSTYKPNYKAPSLFPAYTPKDNNEVPLQRSQSMQEEISKSTYQSPYNSDLAAKSSTYCDKTTFSPRVSKSTDLLHEKTDSYQERNPPANEVFPDSNSPSYMYDKSSFKAMSNSPIPHDSLKTLENTATSSNSKFSNSPLYHDSLKTLESTVASSNSKFSNSPILQDSLKTLENTVTSSNSKFPFSPGNAEACFQTPTKMSLQRSQVPNHPSTTASRDCLMQNVPFSHSVTSPCHIPTSTNISSQSEIHQSSKVTCSSFNTSLQSDIHQNSKETFSSFNTSLPSDIHGSSKETFSSFNAPLQSDVHQSSKETVTSFNTSLQSDVYPSSKESFSSFNTSLPSNVNQSSKETFSSFNFESNMNSDIADLLPGLDAFLKETLNKSDELSKPEETLIKSEDDVSKTDLSKSSVPTCAFSDDEWSKHSIPFIGDNQVSGNNVTQSDVKGLYCDQMAVKDRFHKFESVPEKPSELKLSDINQSSNTTPIKLQKDTTPEKQPSKAHSALEEAIELLVKCDAIIGLDYIIEYKKNISQQGSLPFRCNLCNSSISRPAIIDHIIGSKHRMRYIKSKNESKHEYLVSLKLEKSEKDTKIAEVAFQMEMMYGRGYVIVNTEDFQKDISSENKCKEVNEGIEEPVFTLDKIPIGFEALSPQHEEMDSSAFPLESDLNPIKQDTGHIIQKEIATNAISMEVKKEVSSTLNTEPVLTLPGLGSESPSYHTRSDSNSALPFDKFSNNIPKTSSALKEPDVKMFQSNSSCQVKRSLSPEPSSESKIFKAESSDELKSCTDMLVDQQTTDIKVEASSVQEEKEFNLDIVEALSKSVISSEEEASVVLKIINMLMQIFLRYKLQHLSFEKVENLMKSLQIRSPENIEELKSLLNENNMPSGFSKEGFQENTSIQDSSKDADQKLPSHTENNNVCMASHLSTKSVENVLSHESTSTSSYNVSQTLTDISINNITSVPQTSGSVTVNVADATKYYPDCNTVSQVTSKSQPTNTAAGLKPPPFFSWSQNNDTATNQVSYANVQSNQNMMWNTAYQYSQPQYAQIPYYQPQNYGNTFSGTQSYPSQFSVVPMAQPPAPPPPPPPPSNPPLPPSVPLPANPPPCVSLFSSQPPPPPLP